MRLRSQTKAAGEERPKEAHRPSKKSDVSVARVPHDPINEQALISAALSDPEARARLVRILPADGFYAKGHSDLWAAIVEAERRRLAPDASALRSISAEVDVAYVRTLSAARKRAENLAFHVECFFWDRVRVESVRGPISALLEALSDPSSEQEKVRSLARSVGESFKGSGPLRYLRDPALVTESAKRRVRARRERFAGGEVCYPYGIEGLDNHEDGRPRLVPGMAPRQMTLIAGVSGSGKTTLSNQVVLARANAGERVLHGAWEQDGETNLEMLAAYSLRLSRTRLWIGDLTDEENEALDSEMDRLGGGERPLVRFFDLPFDRTRAERRRSLNETNLDVVHEHVELSGASIAVFDLFAKVMVETKPDDEKRSLDRMLGIAKETGTHLVLLHHLKKDDLSSSDRRPTRESIKGSTAWIDAFDTVIGTHLPGLWKNVPNDRFQALILKQRYGKWPIAVEFEYDEDTGIISAGRSVEYEQPGAKGDIDSFLDEPRKKRRE